MHARWFLSLSLLALSVLPAHAQSKQKAAPASATETRYFTSLNDVMDGEADIILRETRQGGRITAASLDMCYPASANSDRKERFTLDLAINGSSLSGSTQTMRDKLPVSVNLTQRGAQGKFEFRGKITAGSVAIDVASAENSDVSEQEFKDEQTGDDNIVTEPKDFTEVSPESLAVKLKLASVADFIKSLRGQPVELSLDSLTVTCSELRAGEQVIYLTVNPDQAPAIVAKLRTAPGVVTAGWTDGSFELDRTLRFAASAYSEGGKLNREKLASEVSATLAQVLGATSSTFKWDEGSGELTLTVKRPYAAIPDLGLTDVLEFSALVSPERPGGSDRLLLWLSRPTVNTTDETPGDKLNLYNATTGDEEGAEVSDGGSFGALARALKAQRWDADKSAWQ